MPTRADFTACHFRGLCFEVRSLDVTWFGGCISALLSDWNVFEKSCNIKRLLFSPSHLAKRVGEKSWIFLSLTSALLSNSLTSRGARTELCFPAAWSKGEEKKPHCTQFKGQIKATMKGHLSKKQQGFGRQIAAAKTWDKTTGMRSENWDESLRSCSRGRQAAPLNAKPHQNTSVSCRCGAALWLTGNLSAALAT